MQSILSILLALIIALTGATGLEGVRDALIPSSPAQEAAEPAESGGAEAAPAIAPAQARQEVDWADMAYAHYDPESFYVRTDRLADLAAGEDAKAVIDLYDELYEEMARIATLANIAYVHYSADVTDEYWSEENIYCDTLVPDTADALSIACNQVMNGPCAQAFAEHVGQDAADAFREYVPMTDRESELVAQEAELVDQYFELMDSSDELKYNYLGKDWTFDLISSFIGSGLAARDYEGYLQVYFGLQKMLNDQVGPIFLQLVKIRTEIAQIEGYDTYTDYAYEEIYGRDYTGEDAQALCDAVKAIAPAYYQRLYQSDLWYNTDAVQPAMDKDKLLEVLGAYAARVDNSLTAPWEFMTSHGLCDIGEGDGRLAGAYTDVLYQYDSAFIFMTTVGDCYDLGTLSHEFGHFVNSYYHPDPNLLTSIGCYDLLEIHSNGLEALFTAFYDEIYSANADTALFIELGSLMENVLSGCIFDEFQRRIYADPDMTLEEVNKLYTDICAEYGQFTPAEADYGWVNVSHTFEAPMYYISYAASALAAIQIWDMAQSDFQSGVDAWLAVLEHGGYDQGYMDVLPECGLRLFTEQGAVEDICAPLMAELRRLDGAL